MDSVADCVLQAVEAWEQRVVRYGQGTFANSLQPAIIFPAHLVAGG